MSNPMQRFAVCIVAMLLLLPAAPALAQSSDAVGAVREGPLLYLWTRGAEVAAWQDALNDWLSVNAPESGRLAMDGVYGPKTQQATIHFQRASNITVDGIVGPETRGALVAALTDSAPPPPPPADGGNVVAEIREGPLLYLWVKGGEVASWQSAFNAWLGRYPQGIERISVDGIYGPSTQAATIDFQSWADIGRDGIVGPVTRGAMVEALTREPPPDDGGSTPPAEDVLSPNINTDPDTGEASGPSVSVTDVRLGRHEGYDRVVFEIGGEGVAGWNVRYVDAARAQGSGNPIEVAGDAILAVTLNNIALPPDAPQGVEPWDGPDRMPLHQQGPVIEVVEDTIFEGHHTFFVGVSGTHPFQVRRFESPQRVVLDVAAP